MTSGGLPQRIRARSVVVGEFGRFAIAMAANDQKISKAIAVRRADCPKSSVRSDRIAMLSDKANAVRTGD